MADRLTLQVERVAREIGWTHQALRKWLGDARFYEQELLTAGVFDRIPSEQWQSRPGSEGRYLYLLFGMLPSGAYSGPDGRRKLYVGSDPARVQAARERVERTRTLSFLRGRMEEVTQWVLWIEHELTRVAAQADRMKPGTVPAAPGVQLSGMRIIDRRSGDGD